MLKKFKKFKSLISILIILTTISAVVYYLIKHQTLLTDLRKISPYLIIMIVLLYVLMLLILALIFKATIQLLDVKIRFKDNILLNAYSIFMNFFVPGQTGPIYRGYYLKTKHKVKILDFTVATAIDFAIYTIIAILCILFGSQSLILAFLFSVLFIFLAVLAVKIYLRKEQAKLSINFKTITTLSFITLAQFLLQFLIYLAELHSVDKTVTAKDALTYTGSAALTIFVALTPGAIGIREGFLILTNKLSHVSSSYIVLANIIDRSVYLIFLLMLGLLIITFHLNNKLKPEIKIKPSVKNQDRSIKS